MDGSTHSLLLRCLLRMLPRVVHTVCVVNGGQFVSLIFCRNSMFSIFTQLSLSAALDVVACRIVPFLLSLMLDLSSLNYLSVWW